MTSCWPSTHLNIKSNLYKLSTYSRSPNFDLFGLRPAAFEKQGCWKSEKAEMHRMTRVALNTSWSKVYIPNTYPEVQILVRFAIWSAVSKIQGCRKSEMHQVTSDWPYTFKCQRTLYTLSTWKCAELPWTLNGQKYHVCTTYLSPEVQIMVCFALRPAVSRYRVVENRKQIGKCNEWPQDELKHLAVKSTQYTVNTNTPEAQIFVHFAPRSPIFNFLALFIMVHWLNPGVYKNSGRGSDAYFLSEVSFETSIWWHVNENERNKKCQNLKFHNSLNNRGIFNNPVYSSQGNMHGFCGD